MNVLLTSIGSFSADCVIKSLKKLNHRVIGCDINPKEWLVSAKDCDSFYMVPLSKEKQKYLEAILNICQLEKIDVFIPLTDAEIDVLNHHRSLFEHIGCRLCIQSKECLGVARNKWNLYQHFQNETKFRVAKTIESDDKLFSNAAKLKFPCVLKPKNGRSSEGLSYVHDLEDLRFHRPVDNNIVQEFIEGSVYTVDYVRDRFSNDFSVAREELLRTKNGAGTTVRVSENEVLHAATSLIGNRLGIIGAVNMEFIANKGEYYLIDINPRFSAGIAFTDYVGYDIVRSSLNCFLDGKIDEPISFDEKIICKRFCEEEI